MPQYRLCPIAAVDIRAGAVVGTDKLPFCLLVTEVSYGSDGSVALTYLQGFAFVNDELTPLEELAEMPMPEVTSGELWMHPGDNLALLVAV